MARVGASKGRHGFTLESLYQKWLISPEAARITVQYTTHQGIGTTLNPYFSRQLKTNDRALRYNRLQHSVFTNTMQAGTVYKIGNWYAQVYLIEFGWSIAHPMKNKGDAHETLPLFFKRDGVPPKMVMDG